MKKQKNNENFLITLALFISFLAIIYLLNKNLELSGNENDYENNNESTKDNSITIINNIPKQNTNRYDDDTDGPSRDYFSRRINIRTRGEPDEYQTVGVLKKIDSNEVLPLIGRQTYPGSNQWNYFTMTDSHLKTEIPIKKERNCVETIGCSEIQKNDTIDFLGSKYSVELYPYNKIRYIPYI